MNFMVKGVNYTVLLDEPLKKVPCMTEKELSQVTKKVKDTVARDVKTIGEIPTENIRARYASQIDPPVINRFK